MCPYMDEVQVFEESDRVVPIHPVYAIPQEAVEKVRHYFSDKQGF